MIPTRNGHRTRLVSLPWYDLEEVRWATDALWRELRRQLRAEGLDALPERLNRSIHYEQQWASPEFLFGQACGYDVRIAHAERLQVVATPSYRAPGCGRHSYSSFVVVREDAPFEQLEDLRGHPCVINTPTSHSGMNVLRAMVAPMHCNGAFFAEVKVSGAHESSLRMIARREVDVAAIDCVTHALLARHRPQELAGTRVLCRTQQVPAPPYVTGAATSPQTLAGLRAALTRTLVEPALAAARDALLLDDARVLPEDAYQAIEALESVAGTHDYREMPVEATAGHLS